MSKILFLIFGIALTLIGFGMYSYFNKNLDSIDSEPGKLYALAVLVILMGGFISVISIFNVIRNMN